MHRRIVVMFSLLPLLLTAQTDLGPFRFLDRSKAANYTASAVLGGPGLLAMGLSTERPAPNAVNFLDFIPGYAVKYSLIVRDAVFIQGAFISRARYRPNRKLVGSLGLGLGLSLRSGKPSFHLDLVMGIDYLYNEKYVLSIALVGQGQLAIGLGLHRGYGW
ncbi:MAG: hypothetical protein IH971_00785 [Candidatus Marinimicrobia bacterium]|nr:hypothetical protein [Candidatus Neomarinimicrobiota bacterium]